MPYSIQAVKDQARGRWPSILAALGADTRYLKNRHMPCPFCGGKDRYRFDDKNGDGTFYCNHCGSGSGLDFVMRLLNTDLAGSLNAVAGVLGLRDTTPAQSIKTCSKPPIFTPEPQQDHLAYLLAKINQSQSMRHLDALEAIKGYLNNRGLSSDVLDGIQPDALYFHPAMPYYHDGRCLGNYPAMLAVITGETGDMAGLHTTYLQDGRKLVLRYRGEVLPSKKMRSRFTGSLNGAAVRLFAHTGQLAVCEGIETAFAVRETTGLPVWACLSANGLRRFALPDDVRELVIYADNDSHKCNTGFQAAHALAVRAIKAGVHTKLVHPEQAGFDALDVLNHLKAQCRTEVTQ